MKRLNLRAIHRDLGYFYVGLIISFALSGIVLNHRGSWHPEKFTVESKPIQVQMPSKGEEVSDAFINTVTNTLSINDKLMRHMVRKGELRIMFKNTDVNVDMKTGKGEMITFIKTPLISQSISLHKSTSNWWIYYSDIFGASLIVIAVTGMLLLKRGKNTFKKRGWKLAVAGIVFPLLFLLWFL